MSERATKEITTPGGHKAVILTYVIGQEIRDIENIYISGSRVNVVAGSASAEVGKRNIAELTNAAEDKAIETIVKSLDGDSKDVAKRVLQLPAPDYKAIIKEVENVQNGLGEKKEE